MDHAVLVEMDLKAGSEIIRTLDSQGVDFDVAVVATFADYYDPRLVFAAEWLDEFDPREQYRKFYQALGKTSAHHFSAPLMLMKTTDPFIVDLRDKLGKLQNIEGMRLDSRSFGGRYLADGYVYRVK